MQKAVTTKVLKFLPEKKQIIHFSIDLTTNYHSRVKPTTTNRQRDKNTMRTHESNGTSKCYLGDIFTPRCQPVMASLNKHFCAISEPYLASSTQPATINSAT